MSSRLETAFAPIQSSVQDLWVSLAQAGDLESSTRIAIAGARHRCGATAIAACSAIGIARYWSVPVLLVEANVSNPGLERAMGMRNSSPGFFEILTGQSSPAETIQETGIANLAMIPAGNPTTTSLGGSHKIEQAIDAIGVSHQIIVLDTGPLLDFPESFLSLQQSEQAVFVAQMKKTRLDEAKKCQEIILASGARLIGSVLNRYRRDAPAWVLPD